MKALFFGSVGTICDTSELQRKAFNEAFRQHGIDWIWERDIYRRLLSFTSGQARIRAYSSEIRHEEMDDSLISNLHASMTRILADYMYCGAIPARPGVLRLLESAKKQDLKLGLVTSTERTNLEVLDYALGASFSLADFDIVTDRSMLEPSKPDSLAYRVALQSLGLHSTDACAIEDTSSCVAAAVAADIVCIATPNEHSLSQDFSNAAAVLNCLGDVGEPATLLCGAPVLKNEMVTLGRLSALLPELSVA